MGLPTAASAPIAPAALIPAAAERAAAHHLVGNGVDLDAVDDDGAAVKLRGPVVVEGGIPCYVDGSAVYDDIAVGVDPVGVAGAHDDRDAAAVDHDGYRTGFALAGGA